MEGFGGVDRMERNPDIRDGDELGNGSSGSFSISLSLAVSSLFDLMWFLLRICLLSFI